MNAPGPQNGSKKSIQSPKVQNVRVVKKPGTTAGPPVPKAQSPPAEPQPAPITGYFPEQPTALVVDDEPANRDFLVRLLRQTTIEVEGASTGKEAIEKAIAIGDNLCLVMLDRKLPDMMGNDVLDLMRPRFPHAKIMMATMYDERSMIREAFKQGANAFLVKPHGFMELFHLVKQCITVDRHFDALEGLIFDQYGRRQWRGV